MAGKNGHYNDLDEADKKPNSSRMVFRLWDSLHVYAPRMVFHLSTNNCHGCGFSKIINYKTMFNIRALILLEMVHHHNNLPLLC